MARTGHQEVLVMALFVVTRDSVLTCAKELGIPEEQITGGVMELVREKIGQVLGAWRDEVRIMVKDTIKQETTKCR